MVPAGIAASSRGSAWIGAFVCFATSLLPLLAG
jgi:hypothetical protein